MGLFGRIRDSGDADDGILKETLEEEIVRLQRTITERQSELDTITNNLNVVREEYDDIVANLMVVKKEANQKKAELEETRREYDDIKSKMPGSQKSAKSAASDDKTNTELARTKQELKKATDECQAMQARVVREKKLLSRLESRKAQAQKELDNANIRMRNVRQDLSKSQSASPTSSSGKPLRLDEGNAASNSVIEAASVVVSSLRSRLKDAQDELSAVKQALEKEKNEHRKTREDLKKHIMRPKDGPST